MNPQKVDVNVHPAKLEVRFEEENKVFKAVYHAIKDTLLKGDLIADTESLEEKTVLKDTIAESAKTIPMDTVVASTKPVEKINYTPEIAKKEEKGFAGGLFHRFGKEEKREEIKTSKKEELEDNHYQNNFIAQIYSNKFENKESLQPQENINTEKTTIPNKALQENQKPEVITKVEDTKQLDSMETKVIDTKEVNQKLMENIEKLDNLKIEPKTEDFDEMYIRTFGTMPTEVRKAAQEVKEKEEQYHIKPEDMTKAENLSIFPEVEKQAIPDYKFIGIAFNTYIILELGKELYILDQHAAHERIMYEKVKKNYYSDDEKDSQLMLLPDIISLSHKEMDIAKENMDMFRKAGFTLEEFGENTIKLSGVPNICLDLDTKELFLETLDEINTVARTAKQEKEEKFIATVACKAAVKANMALSKEEVDNLMKQLLVLPNPFTCPHGRPTAIKMTKTDIEKKFSRR